MRINNNIYYEDAMSSILLAWLPKAKETGPVATLIIY